jgi:hypothetical protein
MHLLRLSNTSTIVGLSQQAPTGSSIAAVRTNLSQGIAPHLFSAATAVGLRSSDVFGGGIGDLILWEADQSPAGELTEDQVIRLGERVRQGASLLLTLGRNPGSTPVRLGYMLPTIAWSTLIKVYPWQQEREISAVEWDEALFPNGEPQHLTLPYYFSIRPVAGVERGQSRYERYEQTIQKMKRLTKPGSPTWSRSLLNRDWRVRMTAGDLAASPLLVTGSYGAGRVAVLAASAASFDAFANAERLWPPMLRWLTDRPAVQQFASTTAPEISIAFSTGKASVRLRNREVQPFAGQVVVRAHTWEGALIGDLIVPDRVQIAPSQSASVEVALPTVSSTGYQALDVRNSLQLRVGILSVDGATILAEQRLSVDLDSQVKVEVNTDNLNSRPYPFHAPTPDSMDLFKNRMGAEVGAYAYAPGSVVNAEVVLSNGLTNLAPLAVAVDGTTPANASAMALNDGAVNQQKVPLDGVQAYSTWTGKADVENLLLFNFPQPVTVASIVLVALPGNAREPIGHNPAVVIVELDGKEVARSLTLADAFAAGNGQARLAFKPTETKVVVVRLPWPAPAPGRSTPWLGEVKIEGWLGAAPAASDSQLTVTLENALTGEQKELLKRSYKLDAGRMERVKVPFRIASADSTEFYRLHASYAASEDSAELLSIQPASPLLPISDLLPKDGASIGFIVTRGFRSIFKTGTGTAEILAGWAQPDDLIWAYSRQLKQITQKARTQANRLYVTDDDMRHYSTPWKSFANGQFFYDVATPLLVERMKSQANWGRSRSVRLEHSDRWDTGPETQSLHSWQDYVEFDRELRRQGKPGLKGMTRSQIGAEIHAEHESQWQAWHLTRYVGAVRTLRGAFEKEDKDLTIVAQGLPLVAGAPGAELARTIRGMSDDHTWGMAAESIPLTTGRQLAEIAYNPVWKVSTLLQWGFDSAVLNNEHWHSPVSTTESSRRNYCDRAWRAMLWSDGRYGSVYTYGYNQNVGTAYTMNDNDWQQWWMMQERHSLLSPEAPLGAGLVLSSSYYTDAAHTSFSCGEAFDAIDEISLYARVFQYLHESGVSISFGANASKLDLWQGTAPLILVNLNSFNGAEIASIKRLLDRGVRIAAFAAPSTLSGAAAKLFPHPNALLIDYAAQDLNATKASKLFPKLQENLQLPIAFPKGTAGYGFKMGSTSFIVVEDWLEQGREAVLRVKASTRAARARACNINDHVKVPIHRDGEAWVLNLSLRPGDGAVFVIEEEI